MRKIDANNMDYVLLNDEIKYSDKDIIVENVLGQRYIACGTKDKNLKVYGTCGNAAAAYLEGGKIEIFGNVQDAVADTMNDGCVIIHGSAQDALGYAMRGGKIYVEGKSGYRTGIHMKEYEDKKPVIVIGKTAGNFLGEYLSGGLIIVLNLDNEKHAVGDFIASGMHGGKIFIRGNTPDDLPEQVTVKEAENEDMEEILTYIDEFAKIFDRSKADILNERFYCITANTKNPYRRLYVSN